MFMHIVTQLSGRITALFTQALASLKVLLCKLVNNLRVNITRAYQNVRNLHLLNLLRAQTGWKTNPLVVNLTTAVQSIKAAHTYAKAKLTQIGPLPLTIARQTLQRVKQLLKAKA
jgi:hypothetical protein